MPPALSVSVCLSAVQSPAQAMDNAIRPVPPSPHIACQPCQSFALTGETVSLSPGEKEGFLILFPVTIDLDKVQEATFTVRGNSYTYTDLNVRGPL